MTVVVPNIVHQIYDYQSPNLFLFLSLKCVQQFLRPEKHYLIVNNEGKYRRSHWELWLKRAEGMDISSWEYNMSKLIQTDKITVKLTTFPSSPPGNDSIYVSNKAHRSDFVRMQALETYGGIYIDTDAFALRPFEPLRHFDFTLAFDNIVNPDSSAPKRLNNGVLISAANATFLKVWTEEYRLFNPNSFDYDSSVVPFRLATQFPDLVNIEMSRLSPISYSFQTSVLAEAITCGILTHTDLSKLKKASKGLLSDEALDSDSYNAIWHPKWNNKMGICMMRKNLNSPSDLNKMPSLLGRIFRIALYGRDDFDYAALAAASNDEKLSSWKACRNHLGMHATPDIDDLSRQQFVSTRAEYII